MSSRYATREDRQPRHKLKVNSLYQKRQHASTAPGDSGQSRSAGRRNSFGTAETSEHQLIRGRPAVSLTWR